MYYTKHSVNLSTKKYAKIHILTTKLYLVVKQTGNPNHRGFRPVEYTAGFAAYGIAGIIMQS